MIYFVVVIVCSSQTDELNGIIMGPEPPHLLSTMMAALISAIPSGMQDCFIILTRKVKQEGSDKRFLSYHGGSTDQRTMAILSPKCVYPKDIHMEELSVSHAAANRSSGAASK